MKLWAAVAGGLIGWAATDWSTGRFGLIAGAFIGVGVLILLNGYFAPVPLCQDSAEEKP